MLSIVFVFGALLNAFAMVRPVYAFQQAIARFTGLKCEWPILALIFGGGHSRIISDAQSWPSMEGRSLAGYQQKKLWLNRGDGKFLEVAQAVGVKDTFDGRSVALVDLQNRGVLDVIVANRAGPLLLYRNNVEPNRNWIAFQLEGSSSNRSALGARVRVRWKGQEQLQEVVAASGYSAQNQRRLHFGLGENARVDIVAIRWPSPKMLCKAGSARTPPELNQFSFLSRLRASCLRASVVNLRAPPR